MTHFDTTSTVRHFEDGTEVFPCRCGETHRGDYAANDYWHHNCFHDAGLWQVADDDHYICAACGKDFFICDDFPGGDRA